jgi:hypothetical protein
MKVIVCLHHLMPTNGGGDGHTPGTLTGRDEVSRSEEEINRASENFRPA